MRFCVSVFMLGFEFDLSVFFVWCVLLIFLCFVFRFVVNWFCVIELVLFVLIDLNILVVFFFDMFFGCLVMNLDSEMELFWLVLILEKVLVVFCVLFFLWCWWWLCIVLFCCWLIGCVVLVFDVEFVVEDFEEVVLVLSVWIFIISELIVEVVCVFMLVVLLVLSMFVSDGIVWVEGVVRFVLEELLLFVDWFVVSNWDNWLE